jgi:fatty-acyl-CoA synthase
MTVRVPDWVSYHARVRPNEPALRAIETGRTYTWEELGARVSALAAIMSSRYGIGCGDRVVLVAENDPRIFEVQFACLRLGAIMVPLNWRLSHAELTAIVADATPTAIFYDRGWREVGVRLARQHGVQYTLAWDCEGDADDYERMIEKSLRLGELLDGGRTDGDDLSHILYTSGTTGAPKGALSSRGTLMWHALNMAHVCGMAEPGCHHLNTLPLFHAGGLNNYSNAILYWGGCVSTTRRFSAQATLDLLTDPGLRVTHYCGIPQMWVDIAMLASFATATFPALRHPLFGGPAANMDQEEIRRLWEARGVYVHLAYGSSEQGPLSVVLDQADGESAGKGSSGICVPYVEIRLVNDAGDEVPLGEIGEIWVRGPAITPGYWKRSKSESFSGNWFRTGDLAWTDELGHYYVVGRLRDVYRTGGENVYPAEVERILEQMPEVAEISVVGVPDDKWGETGAAFIVPAPGERPDLATVRQFAEGRLARYKLPVHVILVDELPRSATFKVVRTELRERFAAMRSRIDD